ncbi:hypothetical protein [Desulforamulus reducens]|nr:hypothetical protein [Desulforamulus reducens]
MIVSKQQALDNAYAILIKRAKLIIKGEKTKTSANEIKPINPRVTIRS